MLGEARRLPAITIDSALVGTTVAYATGIGAVLGFALRTRASEWLGDLLTSLW